MYNRLAFKITDAFISRGVIKAERRNIYAYGFEVLFATVAYIIIFILISLFTNRLIESIVFFLGFYAIRKFCGGFHAKTYFTCHMLFAANHIAFIILLNKCRFLQSNYIIGTAVFVATIVVFFFAPADHPNKPFVGGEYKKFKARSRVYCIVLLCFSVLSVIMIFPSCTEEQFSFMFGTVSATISLLSANIQNTRRSYHEKNHS